jgi:hypothetical protein
MVLGPISGMNSSFRPRNRLARCCGAAVVVLLLSLLWLPPAAAGSAPERFGFGESMRVNEGERVDTVVTIGGDLTVLGEVEDDAIVVGGTLELGPHARVGGDAVAMGGHIVAANGATIGGEQRVLDSAFARDVARFELGPITSRLAVLVQVLGSFLLSALILLFAPDRVRSVAASMRARPGRATLFGLGILLLFLPLLGALTISIVGIPLIPVVIMLLAAVFIFGMAALGLSLGYAMPFYTQERSAVGALAIGYLLIAVVAMIPWVGGILLPLAGLFAGGATLGSWFGSRTVGAALR